MTNTTDTRTNDLIEQVARAIYYSENDPSEGASEFDDMESYDQEMFRIPARAAVLCVRRFDAEHGPGKEGTNGCE